MNTVASEKKKLTVSILGKKYSIVTDEDQVLVEEAANMLHEILHKLIAPSTSLADTAKKTTFVSLQMAVDLLKKRRELEFVTRKTSTLNDLLRESL